jgi:hypothetical protein
LIASPAPPVVVRAAVPPDNRHVEKPVIVLADDLPVGLRSNLAAVLGMSLGKLRPDPVGADTPTKDGFLLPGVTTVAVPVLSAPAAQLPLLFTDAAGLPVRLAYMEATYVASGQLMRVGDPAGSAVILVAVAMIVVVGVVLLVLA